MAWGHVVAHDSYTQSESRPTSFSPVGIYVGREEGVTSEIPTCWPLGGKRLASLRCSPCQLKANRSMLNKRFGIRRHTLTRWRRDHERTLKYRFSFRHLTKEELSSAFTLKQTEFLNDFVCRRPEMKVFVDHGVTLKYAYYDRHRKLVVIITVDTRTCGSK